MPFDGEQSEPTKTSGTVPAVLTSTGMIAQQVAGKAVRDAVFLSSFATRHLPYAMAAASALSLLTVGLMPRLQARISPRRLMPAVFAFSGALYVLEWLLLAAFPRPGALAVYLHTTVLGPLVISVFWSFVDERFDPHSARRAVARIAGGGTLGGVLGGVATWQLSKQVSFPSAVALLGGLHLFCAASALVVPRGAGAATRTDPGLPALSAFSVLREVPFLRNLAILVTAGAALSSLLDYVLGAQAVAHYGRGANLLAFFSIFGLCVSVVSLVLQVTVGRFAVEKVALAVHIAILPGVITLGSAFGLAVPGLLSAALLRGAEMVHRNTLFRSAYELLYTPVPEAQKRAVKSVIDVGFDRAGSVGGSLVTMVIIHVVASGQLAILGTVLVLTVATLPLIRNLQRGYVEALEQRLREGSKSDPGPISVEPDEPAREKLIDQAQALRGHAPLEEWSAADAGEALAMSAELASGDPRRARSALERLTPESAPFAIMLLAHPELHRDARLALRRIAGAIPGQLSDALLATTAPDVVRRRIPTILVASPSQRAADGLFGALSDPVFEVRYAAGRALVRMMILDPSIELSPPRVAALVVEEAARANDVVAAADDESLSDEAMAPLDIVIRDRVSRGLEHLFTVLALLVERDALRLCFRALHQEDVRYRGTALEYLQTVLPADVRDAIWPLLGETDGPLPKPRPPAEVLADLTKAVRLGG